MRRIPFLLAVCAMLCLATGAGLRAGQVPFEEVIGNLAHADPEVRVAALRLLRESAFPEAAVPVANVIADPDDRVQVEAIDTEISLFLAEDVPARKRIAGIVEVRNQSQARTAFAEGPHATLPTPVPSDVIAALIKAIRDDAPRVRYEALYALGVLAPTGLGKATDAASVNALLDALVYGLKDAEPLLRTASADVLGRLYNACETCGPAVKDALTNAKATIGDNLIAGMNDKDKDARMSAARALGAVRYEQAVKALIDQVEFYKRGQSVMAPLDALAHMAHPSSVPLLQSLINNRDPMVRRYAFEGLARTGDKTLGRTVEEKVKLDNNESSALALALALHRLGRGERLNVIIGALRKPALRAQAREYLLELGTEAVPILLSYLRETDSETLIGVSDVLGRLRDPRAVVPLEAQLKNPDRKVVAAVEVALLRLGRPVERTP